MTGEKETIRQVKEFLARPHRLQLEINRNEALVAELRACLTPKATSMGVERVQTSPHNKMESAILRIQELEEHIAELKMNRLQAILKVNDAIERLDHVTERTVIAEWYIYKTPAEDIANKVGYCERQMYYYKREGEKHIAEKIAVNCSNCL